MENQTETNPNLNEQKQVIITPPVIKLPQEKSDYYCCINFNYIYSINT
jgi:hypothetical protein